MASADETMKAFAADDLLGRITPADMIIRRSSRLTLVTPVASAAGSASGTAVASGLTTISASPTVSPSGELILEVDDAMGVLPTLPTLPTRSLSGSYACTACKGSSGSAGSSSGSSRMGGCACPDSGVRAWTTNPNALLVKNAGVIAELKRDVIALVATLVYPNRDLMGEVGEIVERLSGQHDFCFFEELPPVGSDVVVLRALCPLYGKTLADGDDTLTGSFVDSFERALEVPIVRTNINMECLRKSDADGDELTGGSKGCCDPTGVELRVLADVKDMHFLCLRAAGVRVLGVIASSNGSITSFGVKPADVEHFVAYDGLGIYAGIPIFFTPHPKYASATCINNASVTQRIGGSLGDRLSTPSRVLNGWATMGSSLLRFEGDEADNVARDIYERVRMDETSRVTVREWDLRFSSTTTPETDARLKEELRKQSSSGGAFSRTRSAHAPENAHVLTHPPRPFPAFPLQLRRACT